MPTASAIHDAAEPRPAAAGRRLRAIYAAAWLPLLGVYALVFLVTGLPAGVALRAAAANVLPPALLGGAVLRFSRRLAWAPGRRARFFAAHAGAAAVYAGASTAGSHLLFALDRWATSGRLSVPPTDYRVAVWQLFLDLLLYCTLASVAYAWQFVARLREEESRAARAEALRAQAELRALRAQLNPHFLFNTLHTLLALVRRDPAAAEEALEQFGDLLRYALSVQDGAGEEVTLAQEWEFVGNYLALERLRLGDRLALDARIGAAALPCRVPAFSLQPLVENAIRHGIAPRAGGGRLVITAGVEGGVLALEVRDDGPGAATWIAPSPAQPRPLPDAFPGPQSDRSGRPGEPADEGGDAGDGDPATGGGMGLRLVRRRLAALHGEAARLEVTAPPGGGFAVTIRLPARSAAA
jgi:signal transduction histidine kinase